jgi:carbamoyl-phosphate synthase large subunit
VSYTSTISGAEATCLALKQLDIISVNRLQNLY